MTAIAQAHRPTDPPVDRRQTAATGTDEAFGQLLRSMEQDLWACAPTALPADSKSASRPAGHTGKEPRFAAEEPAAIERTMPQAHSPSIPARLPDTVLPAPSAAQSNATIVEPRSERIARSTTAFAAPFSMPQPAGPGSAGACIAQSIESPGDATRSRGLPAAYIPQSSTSGPLRITVLPGQIAPAVAVRIALADANDVEILDSHIRAALLQGGFRASKLVINGVDRPVMPSGEPTHGD